MTKQERELFEQTIELWGHKSQMIKTAEEMGELIQAICKHLLKSTLNTQANLVEEVADVSIMIDQIKMIVGEKSVEDVRAVKVKRLGHFLSSKSLNIK